MSLAILTVSTHTHTHTHARPRDGMCVFLGVAGVADGDKRVGCKTRVFFFDIRLHVGTGADIHTRSEHALVEEVQLGLCCVCLSMCVLKQA